MADQDPTKTAPPSATEAPSAVEGPSPAAASDMVSLDDLDALLAQEDPEFTASVREIGQDTSLNSASAINAQEALPDPLVEVELQWQDRHPRLARWLSPVLPVLKLFGFLLWPLLLLKPRLKKFLVYLNSRRMLLRNWLLLQIRNLFRFVRTDIPRHLLQGWQIVKDYLGFQAAQLRKFRARPLRQKALIYLAAVLFVSSIGIIFSVVKGGVLGRWRAERLQDLRLQADAVFAFDAAKDLVPFYQAFPQPEFTVLMNKFVVNLKPESAHPTAMGFFHLFFNCDSQDTAVELKDREQEVSDFVQRIVERFTYSEVNSRIGEERMKDTIREEVNRLLNQGRVKNVYLNYKITKP